MVEWLLTHWKYSLGATNSRFERLQYRGRRSSASLLL